MALEVQAYLRNYNDMSLDQFDQLLQDELVRAENRLAAERSIQVLEHEDIGDDNDICAAVPVTRVQAAVDSGSVDNVIHPGEIPDGIDIEPNKRDKHFLGANNTRIENYGTCTTAIKGKTSKGSVDAQCNWSLAEVSRPLRSVSKLCGPIDEPHPDVLFNNRKMCGRPVMYSR